MKERPILFSTPMVRAILENRKSVTRRIIKWPVRGYRDRYKIRLHLADELPREYERIVKACAYGQVGSHLWVRETWRPDNTFAGGGIPRLGIKFGHGYEWKALNPNQTGKWKPSIFMPREASRITLEITNIRVERLQDINSKRHDDVAKEGWPFGYTGSAIEKAPVQLFAELWDSINSKRGYSWESNPWVWIIEFKRIK